MCMCVGIINETDLCTYMYVYVYTSVRGSHANHSGKHIDCVHQNGIVRLLCNICETTVWRAAYTDT